MNETSRKFKEGLKHETDYYVDPCYSIRKAVVGLEKRIAYGSTL